MTQPDVTVQSAPTSRSVDPPAADRPAGGSDVADVADIADHAALVGRTRHRARGRIDVEDRRSGLVTGGSFLLVEALWIGLAPPSTLPLARLLACVAVYVIGASVEFEIGPGSALPTTSVLIVMLFVLPPPLVPLAVAIGLGGAALVNRVRDPSRRERPIVLVGSAWHAIGPAAVFAVAHTTRPALAAAPICLLALLMQFALDAASSWVRNCYGLGVATRQLAHALRFTFLCDLLLAPIGLAAALATPMSARGLVLLLPLIALLAMLQTDRRRQLDATVALEIAYNDSHQLARRDVLTNTANRLTWEEAVARGAESDSPFGVIFADVDGLKVANDRHGHEMGDRLIVAVAHLLVGSMATRADVVVARVGGDEFAILIPDTSRAAVAATGEWLRKRFQDAPALDGVVPISASVGVGFAPQGSAIGAAINEADRGVNVEKIRRGVRRA